MRLNLRSALFGSILTTAAAGVLLLGLTGVKFQQLIYKNKSESIVSLVELQSRNILDALTKRVVEIGMDLQTHGGTRDLLQKRDIPALTELLDGQFQQFPVKSGQMKLHRLYAFDVNANLLTKSNEGLKLSSDTSIMCNELVDTAKARHGANRLKPISAACVEDGFGMLGVLVTVASFRPLGYLLFVVDPAYSLGEIEDGLGIPVHVTHPNGQVSRSSEVWNYVDLSGSRWTSTDELIAHYALQSPRGELLANVWVMQNVRAFRKMLDKTTMYSVLAAVSVLLVSLFLAVLLNGKVMGALRSVTSSAKRFSRGEYVRVPLSSFPELNTLIEAFNSMASSITGLISELKVARKDAEQANTAKSQFIASMSHEIRTPLNAILGYAQILSAQSDLTEQQRQAVSTISRSGNHLLELINEILDISKIEAGKMKIQEVEFDLAVFIRDLSDMFQLRCAQAGLDWRVVGLEPGQKILVRGDQGKLRQVLVNLIGNAVKFTASGFIELSVVSPRPGCFSFSVSDSGPGLSTDAKNQLFKAFSQDEEGRRKGGAGLGLAIAAKLVRLMAGQLSLDEDYRSGARFVFEIPLAPLGSTAKVPESDTRQSLALTRPASALVVDDVRENREILGHFLRSIGFTVVEAEDGDVGVKRYTESPTDIVFLDYKMPRMDGVAATRLLKQKYGKSVKAIMVSAMVYEDETAAFVGCGVDAILSKPVTRESLNEALLTILGNDIFNINQQTSRKSGEDVATTEILSAVPYPLLQAIGELADSGLITDLDTKLAELRGYSEQLYQILSRKVESFELEQISKIIRQASATQVDLPEQGK